MRIAVLLVFAGLLAATPAWARERGVVAPPERFGTGRDYTTPGTEFHNDLRDFRGYGWTGRPAYGDGSSRRRHRYSHNGFYGGQRCYQPGLSIRYNAGDWSAQYNSGYSAYSGGFGRNTYNGCNTYDGCNTYGGGWLQDSYCVGGRPVYVFGAPGGFDPGIITPRYGYAGGGGPLYTAPGYPEYGYAGGQSAARDSGYYLQDEYGYRESTSPQVYNDNRVINNYYGAVPPATPVQPAPGASAGPGFPAAPAAPAPQRRAFGQRFQETLKLETPDGAYMFAIRDGAIFAGMADGKPTRLSTEVDAEFGGYGAWLPDSGACLFYRVGDRFCLGYPATDGRWVHEPLPYSVRFGGDTSIGMVGGAPWLTFTTADGSRYVVRYTGSGWEEVGSGKR